MGDGEHLVNQVDAPNGCGSRYPTTRAGGGAERRCHDSCRSPPGHRAQNSCGPSDRQRIREGMQHLPAHPEVRDALERLRDAGLRIVTLTNSTTAVATAQIINAGLHNLFEEVFSADSVRRLKPAPEPYRMTAARFGVSISQVRLVAAHAWDIAGALRAGCAAFVARPGMVLDPLVERPDIVGKDVREIADQIIAVECE
jgi:2-haloacid dehalogenase